MEIEACLKKAAAEAELKLSPDTMERLCLHWRLLMEANARFNITAITHEEAAAYLHYLDCLLAAEAAAEAVAELSSPARCADIGSGGGFPGLVMAAAKPALSFTLIESANKKADFLAEAAKAMGTDIQVEPLRAEEAGREEGLRNSFDLVTARAVAELSVLAEYALPLLKEGGVFLALKGPDPAEETENAARALEILGGSLEQVREYTLPGGEKRTLLYIRKTAPTPEKYPRRPGMPTKKPLR